MTASGRGEGLQDLLVRPAILGRGAFHFAEPGPGRLGQRLAAGGPGCGPARVAWSFASPAAQTWGRACRPGRLGPPAGQAGGRPSTELTQFADGSFDLVITDPPFGELMQYAELADFFYVWLRLLLKEKYRSVYATEHSPKSMEAVANPYREPEDPAGFYQRLLTLCWREAHRVLKASGILAFTFHHSEDNPWVAVLESLFDAGFYLEATYPIRSDETKGEGQFGSQKVEYDIIHVCRKRTEEATPVSWARMRREVLQDVRQIQQLLQNHLKEGLPEADIQVIKRGKALEYFSRHYGKVYVDEGRPISVKDALVGINQLIDETSGKGNEPPPVIPANMPPSSTTTCGTRCIRSCNRAPDSAPRTPGRRHRRS